MLSSSEGSEMERMVEELISHPKLGNVGWVRRESNYLRHCWINTRDRISHAEKQLAAAMERNPHVKLGVGEEAVEKAKRVMEAMYERMGESVPEYVLEGVENQIKRLMTEVSDTQWQTALSFEFVEDGEQRRVKNWEAVVVPAEG